MMQNVEQADPQQNDSDLDQVIYSKTLDLLYRALPGSVFATIIIAGLLCIVLWEFFNHTYLLVWFSIISLINVLRYVSFKYYFNSETKFENAKFWDSLFYLLLILNGICFSVFGSMFLPHDDSVYHYFPIMVLIGISVGAVASLSFRMRNLVTFFILVLSPIFILELLGGTLYSYSAATLIFLLTAFSLINAARIKETATDNIALEHKAKKHNKELIESKDAAIAANSAKSLFISMISHELRTPLNAILGFSQLLKISDSPKLNDEQADNTQGIIDSGNHLLSLIEDLLELSQIEVNKLSVENTTTSLNQVLEECFSLLLPIAKENGMQLYNSINQQVTVLADHKRLKQVFINLISNAIKYNNNDGNVSIQAEKLSDKKIRIHVVDDGDGLTVEQQAGLFNPFQRYNTQKEGLGLGLYITKSLVELMNGEIGIESEKNKGSSFWVDLVLQD